MACTEITREQYQRDHLRYASDTTDEEWKVIAPHLPPPADCGSTRDTDLRDVINSILLHCADRLPMAAAAQAGLSRLTPRCSGISMRGATAECGRPSNHVLLMDVPRSRRTRGKSDRRCDRQPIGQDNRFRWPARLCGREDDQGPQAAYPDRHHRPARRDDRASGERAGP